MLAALDNVTERRIGAEFDSLYPFAAEHDHSLQHGQSVCKVASLAGPDGLGWERRWRFGTDLFALAVDRELADEACINYHGENLLKLHLRLAGQSLIRMPGCADQVISGPFCGMMLHPKGLEKFEWTEPSIQDRWVTIFCPPELFSDGLGLDSTDLPRPLARFVRGDEPPLEQRQLPVSRALLEIANGLLGAGANDTVTKLAAEAKALDLVSALLSDMRLLPQPSRSNTRLSARDLRAIEMARDLLVQDLARPPSLANLARSVGVNRNKLNAGFRQRFDASVGSYLTATRMDHARELLEKHGLSVTETALEVGYEFSSNFATAFKRHFGYAPKHCRRR
jgi:AraC-like DNA-binding protein